MNMYRMQKDRADALEKRVAALEQELNQLEKDNSRALDEARDFERRCEVLQRVVDAAKEFSEALQAVKA